ncbi:MAG: tripartite tricarboxylate transporter substrate binding protein [Betaproteobacteria bacterium]|nr:tripartite tricarboxylate transporter substrate binding protein [Betaproteobacteria bacterium]
MKTRVLFAAIAAVVAGVLAPAAHAQAYPNKPVKIVVPFGAGSATDTVARQVGQLLSESLGQQFIVDNKPGANGTIGADFVAKAAPDGYTLIMSTNTPHAANPSLMKKINYDPVKDFTPIVRVANIPFVLVVNNDVPAKNLNELVELAKKQPGKLSYASGSSGSIISGAALASGTKTDMLHVPYKSIPPGLTDVMGGQVSMIFADLVTGLPQIKANKVRALAVTSADASPLLPGVPPMGNTVKGFELVAWFALFAPANTPADIVKKLNAEVVKALAKPEMRERLAASGLTVQTSTAEELASFQKSEIAKWAKMVKEAGIQPE